MRAGALALAALLAVAAAPAAAEPQRAATAGPLAGAGVLLARERIDVYEVSGAGGLLPADWTEQARGWVRAALEQVVAGGGTRLVAYAPPDDTERADRHAQVLKVHDLVTRTIVEDRYGPAPGLPTGRGAFAWSLGPRAAVLREKADARYALFVAVVEHRLGRQYVTFGTVGNELRGTASLVDLTSGDVLWLNHERRGRLDTAAEARAAVRRLLRDLPF